MVLEMMEKLGWTEGTGKAKVAGTLACMIGAMLLTFYKGPYINLMNPNIDLAKTSTPHQVVHVASSHSVHVLGAVLATGGSLCYAIWLVFQAKINELYPCPYSSVALMNVMASIQSTVFALLTERDWNQWKLGLNIKLLTAAFNGIVGAGLIFTFTAWCVKMRGPVFVSAFNPLTLVLVAMAEFLLLDEKLHLGSFLGSFIIICGLYLVL
ncbi:WAT1-related protein At1g68170-like [Apium graveolens]|uniref:WAT1-related protein At1g68170-like n=1 Tax=Apium graveolens TaxID=4045 RepID=UPI003D78FC74